MSTINVFKGSDGWAAEDNFPMQEIGEGRVLSIDTRKGQRGLYSAASVHTRKDGMITFVIFGDFRVTLEQDKAARCTSKAVAEMHARSLARLDEIKAQAIEFYKNKALKEAA